MTATRSIRTGQFRAGPIRSGLALTVLHDEVDGRDRLDALGVLVLVLVDLRGGGEIVLVLLLAVGVGQRIVVDEVLVDGLRLGNRLLGRLLLVGRAAGGRLD